MLLKSLLRILMFACYLIAMVGFIEEDTLLSGVSYPDDNFIPGRGQHIPHDFFSHRNVNIVRYPIYTQTVTDSGTSTYSHRYAYLVWKTGDSHAIYMGDIFYDNDKISVDSIGWHSAFMKKRFDHFYAPFANAKMIEDKWLQNGDTLLRQSRFNQQDCNPASFTITAKYAAPSAVSSPSLIGIIDTVPNREISALSIAFEYHNQAANCSTAYVLTYWKKPTTMPMATADSLYQLLKANTLQ